MSSILDALNKVEEDRNAQAVPEEDAPFVPEAAADALLAAPGKRRGARRAPLNLKPAMYAACGLLGIIMVVGLSAGVALMIGRGVTPVTASVANPSASVVSVQAAGKETYTVPAPVAPVEAPAQQIAPPPEKPAESVAEKPKEAPASPAEVKPKTEVRPKTEKKTAVAFPSKPLPPAETAAPVPEEQPADPSVQTAKALTDEQPTTPLPTPEAIERARAAAKEPVVSAPPARTSPMSLAPGRAAEKRAPFLDDINALPRLGQNERERLGIGELRLNVLREASPSQPEGLAIINLKKVYAGEMIPGTNARLLAVQSRAIAIEIEGTGERFKVMN